MNSGLRAFGGPGRYIQGPGALSYLKEYAEILGGRLFILIDRLLYDPVCERLERILPEGQTKYTAERAGDECSHEEISCIGTLVSDFSARGVVGIGGGRTLDVAKYVAGELDLHCIVAPTAASTDAPTSAMSVLYREDGSYLYSVRHRKNPDLVLVDSEMIITAPIRLFAAGIGDALATYYEAAACEKSGAKNYIGAGFSRCRAAMAIARECFDTLARDAVKALEDVRKGRLSERVENVIEANTLLSGLGFENTGCAAAHALHTGLHIFPQAKKVLHGEMVAFGVLFQAVMERRSNEELKWLVSFLIACGLPVTLSQFDIGSDEATIRKVANAILACDSGIEGEPFPVTEEVILEALAGADSLGRHYLGKQ